MIYTLKHIGTTVKGISRIRRESAQRHMNSQFPRLIMAVITVVLLQPLVASAAITELTSSVQGKGNKGSSWTPINSFGDPSSFTISARSHIDETQPYDFWALGEMGTIYVEKDDKGTGVQNSGMGGSSGISGGGGDKDEELFFNYNSPVSLESISLELNDIELGVTSQPRP